MQHRLSDATFTYEDGEGKTQTVKGGLFLEAPNDANYGPSRSLGPVYFQTNDLSDTQADKAADRGGVQSPPPPAAQSGGQSPQ